MILHVRKAWIVVLFSIFIVSCVACGSNVQARLSYKPAFLPVKLTVSSSGVSIGGDTSLVTPIGTFSIGASYQLPPRRSDSIYVIIANRKTGYDRIFEVLTGKDQFTVIVNGTTSIDVSNGQVGIDVTKGSIRSITFKRLAKAVPEQGNTTAIRWDTGWSQSWYKPFDLTRWAYSDSTIEKWYGIGFIWFLLRLVLAILLIAVDAILSIGFLLGQCGFIIFGPTGRNIVYGLLVLSALGAIAVEMRIRYRLRRSRRSTSWRSDSYGNGYSRPGTPGLPSSDYGHPPSPLPPLPPRGRRYH